MIVEIDSKRLQELEDAEEKLTLLEQYGVDNWEGYSIAMAEISDDEEDEG